MLLSKVAAIRLLAAISLFVLICPLSGCLSSQNGDANSSGEATVFEGKKLTPISEQRNNAIRGTQFIDRDSYELHIYGMVDKPVNLTYDQLLAYPSVSRLVRMDCVEGWGFDAKWTGITLNTLFNNTGLNSSATTVIFYCADGYSTSLDLAYLQENDIMLAYGINDITLPPDKGFPLQLVAENKYGYKWAKWVTDIEVTDKPYKGYWESVGYSNNANVGGPAFER